MSLPQQAVAIVGLAGRFPGAPDLDSYWDNLRNGAESIRFFSADELRAQGVSAALLARPDFVRAKGVLAGADLFDRDLFGCGAREAALMDPQHRVFLECVLQAFEHAGYEPSRIQSPVGVFGGCTMNTYLVQALRHQPQLLDEVGPSQLLVASDKDFLTTRVSYKLDLKGPSMSVQTACSTSLVAVHVACQSLLAGECDMAVAGGVSVTVPLVGGYVYAENGILSPDGHCRAFDARGQGTVMGNGVGVVVLKRLADALADRDHIHAVIRGSALNNDGSHKVGFTAPSVDAQRAVIQEALAVAQLEPWEIDVIEAHGTGTRYGDPIEIAALGSIFAERRGRPRLLLGSVKTNIGHLDAAAGIAGLIKAVLALRHGAVPRSLHFEQPNPELHFGSGLAVARELSEWRGNAPGRAGVSSFGFGGTNAHVVLEAAPVRAALAQPAQDRCQVVTLSARTSEDLVAQLQALSREAFTKDVSVRDLARSLQAGRRELPTRWAALASDVAELQRVFASGDAPSLRGSASPTRDLVFLFPGQGALTPGAGLALYRRHKPFARALDECCELAAEQGVDLRALARDAGSTLKARLESTEYAQPATFCMSWALAQAALESGLKPAALVGHSLGELTAAALASVMTLEDALRVVCARGRAMQACPDGALLSIARPHAEVVALLEDGLYVSAVNGPRQTVVGGRPDAVDRFHARLRALQIGAVKLRSGRAFHTPLISDSLALLRRAVTGVALHPPRIPIASSCTGAWLTDGEAMDPEYWVRQAGQVVRFDQALASALSGPGRAALEVGPGDTLTGLVRQQVGAESAVAVPLLAPGGAGEERALEEAAAKLWVAGVSVDWERADAAPFARVSMRPRTLSSTRCWLEGIGGALDAAAETGDHVASRIPSPRPACADPGASVGQADVAGAVASAFGTVLARRDVRGDDNFFALGGESLLGIDLLTRIRRDLGVRLTLRELLEHPTLGALCSLVEEHLANPVQHEPSVAQLALVANPAARHEPFPLTPVQRAYWVGRRFMELGGVGSHAYFEIELEQLDVSRLRHAFQRLVERHDMLRAVITDDGEQRVLPKVPPLSIAVDDLRGHSEPARERALEVLREQLSHKVYSGAEWPLFEVRVSHLTATRSRVHFSFDFLIGDALSLSLILREVTRSYREPPIRPAALELTFRDCVMALEANEAQAGLAAALAYWREKALSLPPAPELPLARPASSLQKPTFRRVSGRLEADSYGVLKQRAAALRVTPTAVLLSAFGEVLGAWSRRKDVTINLTVFNRPIGHDSIQELIGDFTTLLLVPVRASRPAAFGDRVYGVQAELWEALEHKDVSAIQVARELARAAGTTELTMPVVFTSTLGLPEGSLSEPGLEARLVYGVSQTPQVWLDHQVYEEAGALTFQWDVVEGLFPAGMITAMFASYERTLRTLAGPDCDWSAWRVANLTPEADLAAVRLANDTAAPLSDALLDQLFVDRAARHPDALAVMTPGKKLTYAQLLHASAQVAELIGSRVEAREPELQAPERVAIVMPRGWEQVVAVLGTLRAGGAYVPIDPTLPISRVLEIVDDARVAALITLPGLLPQLEPSLPVLEISSDQAGSLIRWRSGERQAAAALAPRSRAPSDLAYIIYTSGSTGKPKGVAIDHRGAVNTVLDINRRFAIGERDRVLALSSLSFDLSVFDIFGLLAAGGAMVIPDAHRDRSPAHWLELIRRAEVTVWNTVPALLEILAEHCEALGNLPLETLRCVMLSGDWIPVSLPTRLQKLAPMARQYSLGGATEASIWSIYYPIESVDPAWKSIPYGYPLANQQVHVLDESLEPRPAWVPGELYLSGTGLAVEYWGDPARTQAQFVTHPATGMRLYRTGDWGRRWPDGNIEFLGREDLQVKIRGYRIEVSEIEAKLAQCPELEASAVVVLGQGEGRHLVGCIVLKARSDLSEDVAKRRAQDHLRERLPAYMVPGRWVVLESMPLTSNRKLDRNRLGRFAEAVAEEAKVQEYVPPQPGLEQELAEIWSSLLRAARVGAEDNVFSLGADSLTAIRAHSLMLRRAWGAQLLLGDLYAHPTLRALASLIQRQGRAT